MRLDHLLSKEAGEVGAALLFSRQGGERKKEYPVVTRPGETPVPVPNTKVKTRTADDTGRRPGKQAAAGYEKGL